MELEELRRGDDKEQEIGKAIINQKNK